MAVPSLAQCVPSLACRVLRCCVHVHPWTGLILHVFTMPVLSGKVGNLQPPVTAFLSLFDLQNNQVLGIGSGSTIVHAVQRLGRMLPFLSFPPGKVPFSICPNYLKNTKSPVC